MSEHLLGDVDRVECWPECTLLAALSKLTQYRGNPDIVLLHFGLLDVLTSNFNQIKQHAGQLIETVTRLFPAAQVFMNGVLCCLHVNPEVISTVNHQLRTVCNDSACHFLDLSRCITVCDLEEDGIHFRPECFSHVIDRVEAQLFLNSTTKQQSDFAAVAPVPSTWSYEPTARLFTEVCIGGLKLTALFDSGASHCLLPTSLMTKLERNGVKIYPTRQRARMADGNPTTLTGSAVIPVNLQSKTWVGEFFFADELAYEAVLGVNCLKGFSAVIDFATPVVKIRDSLGVEEVELVHLAAIELPAVTSSQIISTSSSPACLTPDLSPLSIVTQAQRDEFSYFIDSWKERFLTCRGRTRLVKHKIFLQKDAVPLKQRYYPVSPSIQELINKEVDKLLAEDLIQPSTSPWSSPILLVPKKNGQKRFCVDYRKLNSFTIKNAYPLPYINQILDELKDSYYVSSLDLLSGFHQIELEDESRPLTAFTVPGGRGLFEFKVMPFGLTNAPATFQNLIDQVLRPMSGKNVFVYMDDILCISRTFEEHIEVVDKVFNLLYEAGLQINWDKCDLLKSELEYLGHRVGNGQIKTSPSKIESIVKFPAPRTPKQLKSFLGLCSWYKRFIPSLSTLSEPLTRLLHKNVRWHWELEQQNTFDRLKTLLTSAPILHCPDFSKPFVIECDASNVGLGAVLRQKIKNQCRVIAYASRTLSSPERNMSVTHKELLAILFAIEKFKPYVEGTFFTVITDHSSLQWLRSLKQPTGKFARWILRLDQFNFNVEHRQGKLMSVSDGLSRAPYNELSQVPSSVEVDVSAAAAHITSPDIESTNDPWYLQLREKIINNPTAYPCFKINNNKIYKLVEDRVVQRSYWVPVVPTDLRGVVMEQNHATVTTGHLGLSKTFDRIRREYYWPNMFVQVRAYVAKCRDCQRFKSTNEAPAGVMSDAAPCMRPMSLVSADIIGPLPMSRRQNRYAIVFLDVATKFVTVVPLRAATSSAVVKALINDVILIHGVPEVVLTDNGSVFISHQFLEVCKTYGITTRQVPRYYPRGNPVERTNRTVKTSLSIFADCDQRSWDDHIKYIAFAINTAKSDTTGFTPARLTFGRELRPFFTFNQNLLDGQTAEFDAQQYEDTLQHDLAVIYEKALDSVQRAKQKQADTYNLRRRDVTFAAGQLVWRKNFQQSSGPARISAKLLPKYVGPFLVHQVLSPTQYLLHTLKGQDAGRWSVSHLKTVI